jgi:hypothetical protein
MDASIRKAYVRCQGRLRESDTVGSWKYQNYTTQEVINRKGVPEVSGKHNFFNVQSAYLSTALQAEADQDPLSGF